VILIHISSSSVAGYAASSLVLLTFSMRSMRLLRMTAILSNVAFLSYAIPLGLYPIAILHGILLPLNIVRLAQCKAEHVKQATALLPDARPQAGD
jgi:hypothetical protein